MSETSPSVKSLKGMKNIYMCQKCGHGFVSQDVDDGVTPFSTSCQHPGCGSMAYSFFYRAPQEMFARVPAAIEWYRPSEAEILSPATRAHVNQGGLISRPAALAKALGQTADHADGASAATVEKVTQSE